MLPTHIKHFPITGPNAGEFEEPRAVAIDSHENVLVTDTSKHTLQIFDKHGTFIRVSILNSN